MPQVIAVALISLASGAGRTFAQDVVRGEPVVITATRLTADARGTTHAEIDPATPTGGLSLSDLADRVANLHVDAGGAGSFGDLVTLRGLSNTPYFGDPAVAVYFDDIPLGSTFTYPTELFGLSSVTVRRGPQAAAYGRSAEAGVIQFESVTPGDAPGGELRAGFGNYNLRSTALQVTSARTGVADASFAGAVTRRDGFVRNTELGTRVDDQRNAEGAARIRLRPTKTSEVTLELLGSRRRDGAQPLVPIGGPWFTVARGREGRSDVDFGAGALKLAFDTAVGRLSATTSRTGWSLNPYSNRLVLPPTLDSVLTQRQLGWNEEFRLVSAPSAPLPWHLGAWFSDLETNGGVDRSIPGLFPVEGSGYSLAAHTAAVFGEATVSAGAGWNLTGSLRLERVRKRFERTEWVPQPGTFFGRATFDSVLPEIAASRSLGRDSRLSASVALGTKPGGWSAYTDNPALARFRAEKLVALEAGVGTLLAGRTVRLGFRVFDNEVHDYQIERSFTATDYLVVNAPRARMLGGEAEALWRPASGWTIAASVGATRSTLRKFIDPFTGTSYAGHRAPYVPAYNGRLAANYHGATGWFAAAALDLVGRTYYEESNGPKATSQAHAVADARAGYETACWRLCVHAENLADARYYTLMIPGVGHAVSGAPRTYGIEAAIKW